MFRFAILVGALSAAGLAMLISAPARAQQVIVFDVTYTASTQTTQDAHYDVPPPANLPDNWVSPIDYAHGTVYIHQEVATKPSNKATMVDVCFDGDLPGYGCISTDLYTDPGVHETVAPLTTMWQYDQVAWTQRRTLFQLIVKDTNNNNGGIPQADYMPTTMRIVLTVVAPGGTYVPPPPSSSSADSGAETEGGTTADAGPGGSGNEGGTSASDSGAAVDAPSGQGNDSGTVNEGGAATPPPSPDAGGGSPPSHAVTSGSNGCSVGYGSGGGAILLTVAAWVVARLRTRRPRGSL
jgi:hypothetical protein